MDPRHRELLSLLHDARELLRYPIFLEPDNSRLVLRVYPEPGNKPLRLWIRSGVLFGSTSYIELMRIPFGHGILIRSNAKFIDYAPVVRAFRSTWRFHSVIAGELINLPEPREHVQNEFTRSAPYS